MASIDAKVGTAIVTGAGGQDGYFLSRHLVSDGWIVHATTRRANDLDFDDLPAEANSRLHVHQIDLLQPSAIFDLIIQTRPGEFYNLAGQSSVSKSFSDPLYTWQTNAEAVVHLLECIRRNSPQTRFYQASSTDMFGVSLADVTLYDETSALSPQSPYASAKAAAHLLCHSYREVYGLRIACGIVSNHESHRRPASFLSRKVADHVLKLGELSTGELARASPLAMGNLKVRRDWGFAPDYVDGMCRILRQISVRAAETGSVEEADQGANYSDYVLATGETHAVWELVDCAFKLAGFELEWYLDGDEISEWHANFRENGLAAVIVNPALLRAAEPRVIEVDPSKARRELGWSPRQGLDVFLSDMLTTLRR